MNRTIIFIILSLLSVSTMSQNTSSIDGHLSTQVPKFSLSFNGGYDVPSFKNSYTYYSVKPGYKIGFSADYFFKNIGIGIDYDYIKNSSGSTLSNPIFYDVLQINASSIEELSEGITRHFVGLGPSYNMALGVKLGLRLFARAGYSFIKGGELITTADHPTDTKLDHHVMFSGLDAASLAVKAGLGINIKLTSNFAINLGAYYLNQQSVHPDRSYELNNRGNMGMVYGHSPFVTSENNYAIGLGAPYIIAAPKDMNDLNDPYSSLGINVGLSYILNSEQNPKKEKEVAKETEPKNVNVNNKIVVTVEDEISRKVIPGTDVVLKNNQGQIVATGQTNQFGVIEFNSLIAEDYTISGMVYGTNTSIAKVRENELNPTLPLSKKIIYSDLRFILKGHAVNKKTKTGEPGVSVSLTNNSNRSVQQESTTGNGSFAFKLEKNTSYNIVGVKENRLSDMKSATTVGLTRSTTLFVNLELGVENFDCGQGTILNIKYEFDKWELLSESKYEIDRVIRYMKDHSSSMIQMSAHTDSRGDSTYYLSLSDKRAQAAKSYILSRGISSSRVTAQGYGETRLKNHCKDNTNCTEADHAINRRTEATLICRR